MEAEINNRTVANGNTENHMFYFISIKVQLHNLGSPNKAILLFLHSIQLSSVC